ncbi:MAG TPA: O-antigen ligase family protein [Candidatus Baltobacteraceae bacterium]|nr:O-antigen ligase family protein [Candidatus Baltobacteraceae bacterium]
MRFQVGLPAFEGRRSVFLLAIAAFVIFVAFTVGGPSHPAEQGLAGVLGAVALASAPLLVYLALRFPLIFPLGVYVLLVPFDQVLLFSGGATVTRLLAILSSVVLLFHVLATREFCLPARSWFAWMAAVGWMALSLSWTIDEESGRNAFAMIGQLYLMMTVLAVYRPRQREFFGLLAIIVISGVLAAGYTFFEAAHGQTFSENRLSIVAGNGVADDPNFLATSYLLPITLSLAAVLYGRSWFVRVLGGLALPTMAMGLFLTGSRGGVLALLMTFVWFAWRSRYRLQLILIGVFAFSTSMFFPSVWERFQKDPTQQGSGSGRTEIWTTGMHGFGAHWFSGTGLGSFSTVYDRSLSAVYQAAFQGWTRPSHSILVGTLVELGVVGLALVLFAWIASFRQLNVVSPTSPRYPVRIALEATILGLFIQSLFIDPYFIKYFWFAHTMVLLLVNLERPMLLRTSESRANVEQRAFRQPTKVP